MSYVVADTGPLIALAKLNLIELPKRAFGEVFLPKTVFDETQLQFRTRDAAAIAEAVSKNNLQVVADVPWPDTLREPRLDDGERAAIALALQMKAGILIDEMRGRREAIRLGIKVMGVCGLLVTAKHQGWVERVTPLIDQLHQSGYYITPNLRESALRLAGETL